MRRLEIVNEFKQEAAGAMFTKQQAIAVTLQLLQKEQQNPGNTAEEAKLLADAIAKSEFRYIDATKTETDQMLDMLNVARFKSEDIVNAIEMILFDVQ